MREAQGDLWGFAEYGFADVVVVTTNGDVNAAGRAVMGRGCALQAAERFPGLREILASYLSRYDNRPFVLLKACEPSDFSLVSMPVKHHWRDRADTELIVTSAKQLVQMADKFVWQSIAVPRPGCGNGGLKWGDVKPLLEPIFDDRFTVVSF
jgi:Macro domain